MKKWRKVGRVTSFVMPNNSITSIIILCIETFISINCLDTVNQQVI